MASRLPHSPKMSFRSMKRIQLLNIGVSVACVAIPATFAFVVNGFLYNGNDTEFTRSFQEDSFDLVAKGMPKERVLELLGEPFSRIPEVSKRTELWEYSKQGHDKTANWMKRQIYFDSSGAVVRIKRGIAID